MSMKLKIHDGLVFLSSSLFGASFVLRSFLESGFLDSSDMNVFTDMLANNVYYFGSASIFLLLSRFLLTPKRSVEVDE